MPLSMCDIGPVHEIVRLTGNDQARRHMAELGFVEGAKVSIVSRNGENMIVQVADSRVAIDGSMANRIFVG